MASSNHLLTKRVLVTVILALGHAYQIAGNINRDAADEQILKAYKRLLLKVRCVALCCVRVCLRLRVLPMPGDIFELYVFIVGCSCDAPGSGA